MTIGTATVASTNVRSTLGQVGEAVAEGEVEDGEGREHRDPDHERELVLGGRRVRCDMVLLLRSGWVWTGIRPAGRPGSRATARRTSSSTRSLLMAMAAAEPSPAAVMTWARGLTALPATQTPATLVRPVGSATTQPLSWVAQPSPVSRSSWGTKAGRTKTASRRTTRPSSSSTPSQPVVLDDQPGDRALDDADRAGDEPLALGRGERAGVAEVHDVARTTAGRAARAGRPRACRRGRRARWSRTSWPWQ